jgi:hypothetical protein
MRLFLNKKGRWRKVRPTAILMIILMTAATAIREPGPALAQFGIAPEDFIRKMTRIHSANPYRQITFDFSGSAAVEGQLLIFRVSDDCGISGRGNFSLDQDARLMVKAENITVACRGILRLIEQAVGQRFQDYFTLPNIERMAREEGFEFIAFSPENAQLYARLGVIGPVEAGRAVLLGANHKLIDYMLSQIPSRTRTSAILALQDQNIALRWFQMWSAHTGQQMTSALSIRAEIDWETGALRSAVFRYRWGAPNLAITHTNFQNRLVWETLQLDGTIEDYQASVRLVVRLSNFVLHP